MLNWVCAMRCEAKPIIDFYRLKKISGKHYPFDFYRNETVSCTVSGIGAQRMSAAMQWLYPLLENEMPQRWINLGIAGGRDVAIGSAWLIDQVENPLEQQTIAFHRTHFPGLASTRLISLDSASRDYAAQSLFDMEAFAFAQSAQASGIIERSHCIKIISDNAQCEATRNKADISALIAQKITLITDFAHAETLNE